MVTLSRVQSGIGILTVEAACSPQVGDLRLGCAYELRSGESSTVQHSGGAHSGPRDAPRPLIRGHRNQFEQLHVDLRQSRGLRRLAVYAFSETGTPLLWAGTLVVSNLTGTRIELPLEAIPAGTLAILITLYNVHGELVIRREAQPFTTSLRDAAQAYGYDRITWLDDRTPVM
jgi:uncharacterized protein involved in tellurium resistance